MSARYDQVAVAYIAGAEVVSPALGVLVERCGDVRGLAALDLACGHGVVARLLARAGAHVDAVDVSTKLLEHARRIEQEEPLGIRYHHADAADRDLLPAGRFDVVVCNFGISDIDDLPGVCANIGRWLVPGGWFVCSLLHPCFGGAAGVSSSWPTTGSYYDEGWWRADGERSTLRRMVGANHRTFATYVNTLRAHGLIINAVDEPRPESWWITERPDAGRQPVYLVLTCTAELQYGMDGHRQGGSIERVKKTRS